MNCFTRLSVVSCVVKQAVTMSTQANIDHTVDQEEFRFLLTGGIGAGEVPPNPLPWLGDKLWAEMNRLSSLLGFVGFAEELQKDPVSSFADESACPRCLSFGMLYVHTRKKHRNNGPVRATIMITAFWCCASALCHPHFSEWRPACL